MSRGSGKGDTPPRYEAQVPEFSRDKNNWTAGANLRFESDTAQPKPGDQKYHPDQRFQDRDGEQ